MLQLLCQLHLASHYICICKGTVALFTKASVYIRNITFICLRQLVESHFHIFSFLCSPRSNSIHDLEWGDQLVCDGNLGSREEWWTGQLSHRYNSQRTANYVPTVSTVNVEIFAWGLQWWFVYPDTFVPSQYFRINEFSGLLNRPFILTWVPTLFCPD